VGWTTASTRDATPVEARRGRVGRRVVSRASVSAAGRRSWRDAVAGSARAAYAPPAPGAIATIATPAAVDAAAGTTRRNSAHPAANPSTTTNGASTVGPWSTTSTGSAPDTFATSARNPCQSGNAYPGWRPPSGNSFALSNERSPNESSFCTRARWKKPSPPTFPATCQRSTPKSAPAANTHALPGIGLMDRCRSAKGSAARPAPSTSASVRSSDAETAKVTASAAKTRASAHASAAAAPRTPSARATIAPGARTTVNPKTSCVRSQTSLMRDALQPG
jgi:hypothetical protein